MISLLHLFLFSLVFQVATAARPPPGNQTEADPTKRKSTCVGGDNRRQPDDCSVVTLPRNFCGFCGGVGVMQNDGRYDDCLRVTMPFDNNARRCERQLDAYVRLNPCDEARKTALEMYRSSDPVDQENGRRRLDYFVFSICESSCDCVPQENNDPAVKAMDVSRGNCQAHARSHLPDLFPNLKLIRGQGDPWDRIADTESLPLVTPLLVEWKNLHGAGFRQNVTTPIEPEVRYFMERFITATGLLEDNKLWQDCLYLEGLQQGRISTITPLPSSFLCHAESTSGCPSPREQVVMHKFRTSGKCIEKCMPIKSVDRLQTRGFTCGYCDDE